MASMTVKRMAQAMPPGLVRFVGQLQFKAPFLRPLIRRLGEQIASGEGVIRNGAGKGLRFDATGGYPGYLLGTTEPEEQALVARYVKSGGVFYDIGANIGFYTVIGAHLVGERGHVYAFEPFAASVAAVRNNVRLNGFGNVTVVEAAVSDHDGTAQFQVGDQSAGNKVVDRPDSGSMMTQEVRLLAIDPWRAAENARPPDVVMIDVEGAEVEVLRGMADTLARSRPILLCEVHWLGDKMTRCCEEILRPLGYRWTTYSGHAVPTDIVRYHLLAIPEVAAA